MIALLLWSRRLWPYLALIALVALGMLAVALVRSRHDIVQLEHAHQVTLAATDTVRIADTLFRHDTVVARHSVTVYRTARDTALVHLTDTIEVKAAFRKADTALLLDSTAIASAARAIQAHVVLESALRTELAISEKLRAPRYTLTSRAGVEWNTLVPLTELESTVRITERWSVGGRVSKRWAAGEPTRRYVLASYSF
jgi:hypothetical protein